MKTNYSTIDEVIYFLSCIVSLGSIWIVRIIISEAIRKAFKDKE